MANEDDKARKKALALAPKALETLKKIMESPGSPEAARVSAANSILDRAFGKPPQATRLLGAKDDENIKVEVVFVDGKTSPRS